MFIYIDRSKTIFHKYIINLPFWRYSECFFIDSRFFLKKNQKNAIEKQYNGGSMEERKVATY